MNLTSQSADVILIQEHWLWPYELFKLLSYLPEFTITGKSDHRLTESSVLSRGCGGVRVLWRKSLDIGISRKSSTSDRMCCIDIPLNCQPPVTLTIINIYCLSADHNEAEFAQCLQGLEELVCDFTNTLAVAGDFNAPSRHTGWSQRLRHTKSESIAHEVVHRPKLLERIPPSFKEKCHRPCL